MKFTKSLKEKQINRYGGDVEKQSKEIIKLADFCDKIYIAYMDTPLVPIDESWNSKQILEELNKLRGNYVKAKTTGYSPTLMESILNS